ncbi:HisA/HisF-related TIM barrel protein, partial [Geobacillus proteiniphilus]|uniref:HisA/HisF-related TIM barrel protein n=3 Tax=Geobacillus TaxID=129337 RepID=UPI000AF5A860
MAAFTIYPAIDMRGGRCVRLLQGDYNKETVYGDSPVAMAEQFAAQGAEWIHMVDLDGAKEGRR